MSIPGGRVFFTCIGAHDAESFQWLINGTLRENLNLTNVEVVPSNFSGVQSLLFNNVSPDYNSTTVQCIAVQSDKTPLSSNIVEIFVEGK